jgi:hypothetical protein
MARDVFYRLHRCQYCNRPGFVVWDVDLCTCDRDVCKALGFAEVRRRHRDGVRDAPPERRLASALLLALDTVDYALRRDEGAELLEEPEASSLREGERRQTARLLSEIRQLCDRYPPPAPAAAPALPRPNPRHRRFVSRGRSVPLRRERAPERAAA